MELVLWGDGSAEVETIPNCKDRFKLEILTPVKILNQTQTVSVDVAPSSLSARSVLERSNGLIPLPEVWWEASFKVVTYFLLVDPAPTLGTWSDSPPGNLKNFPFKAFNASARSTRRPLGLFL